MQLTVRDVAELLQVTEKSIYRWISDGHLPAYRVSGQYRFNRAELLEWATAHKVNVSPRIFSEEDTQGEPLPRLSEALQSGGIFYRLGGAHKEAALRSIVETMRLPEEVDREFLLQVLLAREALASTAIGEGVAIPHVRNPIVLHVPRPMLTLGFLDKPIEFGALDGQPVFALFSVISPTVRAHLHLLSRLAYLLRDPVFKQAIQQQASREAILEAARRVETAMAPSVAVKARGKR